MHDRVTQIYAKPQMTAGQLAAFAAALCEVVNSCIAVLDVMAGDPDLEVIDDDSEEDDPGGGNVDDEPHDWNELEQEGV